MGENNTADLSLDSRLLLGWCGWPHPEWAARYFPEDLPEDWQLNYFANDGDALYLPRAAWQAWDLEELEDLVDELPEHFRFYLQFEPSDAEHPIVAVLGEHLAGVMIDDSESEVSNLPVFCPISASQWRSRDDARCVVFASADANLRTLKTLLQDLPVPTEALLFEGDKADPAGFADLRVLVDLLAS